MESIGIGINDEIQEKVIDKSIEKKKSSEDGVEQSRKIINFDPDGEAEKRIKTDFEKETGFNDDDVFSFKEFEMMKKDTIEIKKANL